MKPDEIIEALKVKNCFAKTAINILNKDKVPQLLFKIELEPEVQALKKNKIHPIYNLQYLLHRMITVYQSVYRVNVSIQFNVLIGKNTATPGHTAPLSPYVLSVANLILPLTAPQIRKIRL